MHRGTVMLQILAVEEMPLAVLDWGLFASRSHTCGLGGSRLKPSAPPRLEHIPDVAQAPFERPAPAPPTLAANQPFTD